jgi:hypothetical protein
MGEYEKTLEQISYYEDIIADLEVQLSMTENEDDREELLMAIADYHISIGECRGYLQELASIDGYHSYEEMMYECMKYEEV